MSSENIVYRPFVREDSSDQVVINSNQIFDETVAEDEKIEERRRAGEKAGGETSGEPQPVLDEDGNPVVDENGNPVTQEAEPPAGPDSSVSAEKVLADAQAEAEKLRSDAMADADRIRADAEKEAADARDQVLADAREEGLRAGRKEAEAELSSRQKELSDQKEALEADYEAKQKSMEEELVDVILDTVDHVFHSEIEGKKEIVLHLCEDTLGHLTESGQFQIRLNPENCAYFEEHREEILQQLPDSVKVDIVEDPVLGKEDCTIETDGGIFDCSVDTEWGELVRSIRSLSRKA